MNFLHLIIFRNPGFPMGFVHVCFCFCPHLFGSKTIKNPGNPPDYSRENPKKYPGETPELQPRDPGAWLACGDRLRSLQGGREVPRWIPRWIPTPCSGKSPVFCFFFWNTKVLNSLPTVMENASILLYIII